jgi:hypothetical protein
MATRFRVVPAADLFAARQPSFHHTDRPGNHYATNWLLVHYLANGPDPAAQQTLRALLRVVRTGDRTVFDAAVARLDPGALDRRLAAYVEETLRARRGVPVRGFPFTPPASRRPWTAQPIAAPEIAQMCRAVAAVGM